MSTPVVTGMRVVPVAGRDSMLLNLGGAHGPFFTRNLVLLRDSSGATGVGRSRAARGSGGRWRTRAAWSSAAPSGGRTRS